VSRSREAAAARNSDWYGQFDERWKTTRRAERWTRAAIFTRLRIGASITVACSASLPDENWSAREGTMSNVEIRMTKEIRNPKSESAWRTARQACGHVSIRGRNGLLVCGFDLFVLRNSRFLRHSGFVIRVREVALPPPRTRGNEGTSDTYSRVDP